MIVFSDLHLREQTADVCFRVLDQVWELSGRGKHRIIFLGDFWHLRYSVNVSLLNRVNELFAGWAEAGKLLSKTRPVLELLPGNHDQVSVDGRNALEVLARPGVRVWTEPGYDEEGFGYVPYRKDPAQQLEDFDRISDAATGYVFGHFGVRGATMHAAGKYDSDGIDVPSRPGLRVLLGHYHAPHTVGGVEYVGSPYQTTFGEAGNTCGVMSFLDGDKKGRRHAIKGVPRHVILRWDPATEEEPPALPSWYFEGDKVRLDVVASQEVIVAGKLRGKLKRSGLENVAVNVIPVETVRERRFEQQSGESLLDAAQRFAQARFSEDGEGRDIGRAVAALRRWAQ